MRKPPSPIRRARRLRLAPAVFRSATFLLAVASLALAASRQKPAASAPTLRFGRGGNAAEIPMELAANAVFVPVQVNHGRPSNWILDTASPRTIVDTAAAPAGFGEVESSPVLSVPGLEILGADPAVHSFETLGPWYGLRVRGVIGDDLLARLVAVLDYDRLSIELYEPAVYHAPRHTEKLDVRWIDGLPTVRAKLRLGGHTVDGDFALNTGGSAGVLVSSEFLSAKRMYPFEAKTIPGTIVEAEGERAVALARGEWIELGSSRISQPIVAIEPSEAAPGAGGSEGVTPKKRKEKEKRSIAGWIGGEILRKFRVVLDFPNRRILLVPNRKFIFPIEADASGATITAAGPSLGECEVRSVASGSPAAEAGLLPGDRIAVINSEQASDLTLDQIRDLLSQAGESPVLSVVRLGRRVRIQVHLRKLL